MWDLVFRTHQQNWHQLCFILYSFFISLPQNLCQLPFSPRFARQDTGAVTTITYTLHRLDTISTSSATYLASNITGRVLLLFWTFLIGRQSRRRGRCLEPTIDVPLGARNCCKFLISPSYPLLPTHPNIRFHPSSFLIPVPSCLPFLCASPPGKRGTNSRGNNLRDIRRVPIPTYTGRCCRTRTMA